jgi:hypothetical protein
MKRIVLQILLGMSGLLMFFRFGGPALIFGATDRVLLATAGHWTEERPPCFWMLNSGFSAQ